MISMYIMSPYIPEHLRIAFTRVCLSSHRLRIDTGRWARIPRVRRLCDCGAVQAEEHVLVRCPLTETPRCRYGKAVTFPDIIDSANCVDDFGFIHDVMSDWLTETSLFNTTWHYTDAWYQTYMTVLMYYSVITWYQILACMLGYLC